VDAKVSDVGEREVDGLDSCARVAEEDAQVLVGEASAVLKVDDLHVKDVVVAQHAHAVEAGVAIAEVQAR